MKKPYNFNPILTEEIFFLLGKLTFGIDIIDRNGFYCLNHLMRDYKIDWSCGIHKWASQQSQPNKYVPYMPSKALDKKRDNKEQFTKMNMREILEGVLTKSYCNKLFGQKWNTETMDKLEMYEPHMNM